MAKELFPTQLFRIGNEYTRSEITTRLTNSTIGREGVINFENGLVLFVTLEKSGKPEKHQYRDYFKNKSALSNNCAFNFIFGYGESLINKAETIDKKLLNHENTDMAISIWDEKFIIRSVSEDNYDLRIALQKILPYFYNNELPKMWKF